MADFLGLIISNGHSIEISEAGKLFVANKGEDNKISPKIISLKREISSVIKLHYYLEPEFISSITICASRQFDNWKGSLQVPSMYGREKVFVGKPR